MLKDRKIIHFHELNVEVTTCAGEDIREHVSRTVLGTPGEMRYRQTNAVSRMKTIKNIWFLSLRKKNRLLGMVGLAYRLVKEQGTGLNAFYVRYFSIFAPLRPGGRTKKKKLQDNPETAKQNFMKDKLIGYFERMDSLNPDPAIKNLDTLSYAFVEKENARSMNFSSLMGYQTVREFETIYFSRFFPKPDKRVRSAHPSEKPLLRQHLHEMYKEYTLFFNDHLFRNDHYYVCVEEDEIVAGIQAEPVQWEIVEMPGMAGWVFMNLVPHLPLLSRLFQPRKFTFSALEGLWVKEGYEKIIPELFESVCALQDQNVGLSWVDTKSSLSAMLNAHSDFGLLSKIKSSVPGAVRIKFVKIPKEKQQEFFKKPAYISAYDVT